MWRPTDSLTIRFQNTAHCTEYHVKPKSWCKYDCLPVPIRAETHYKCFLMRRSGLHLLISLLGRLRSAKRFQCLVQHCLRCGGFSAVPGAVQYSVQLINLTFCKKKTHKKELWHILVLCIVDKVIMICGFESAWVCNFLAFSNTIATDIVCIGWWWEPFQNQMPSDYD